MGGIVSYHRDGEGAKFITRLSDCVGPDMSLTDPSCFLDRLISDLVPPRARPTWAGADLRCLPLGKCFERAQA